MLDPRIYRTSLVVVLLALIVVAFSLREQPGALSTTLVPDAFNGSATGAGAYASMLGLARAYPDRAPGSAGDDALAALVARRLAGYGFSTSQTVASTNTSMGKRSLVTVTAARPGQASGSIVVVAPRDARGSPATARLSGTAVLLELARVLSGETRRHSIVLASTSGSEGAAGLQSFARTLPRPVEAVIVLGDLIARRPREPFLLPFSNTATFAPPALRRTLEAAVGHESGLGFKGLGMGSQLAHLALPLPVSDAAPFNGEGEPAVELSLAGLRQPAPDEALGGADRLMGVGRGVLRAVDALDGGSSLAAPSSYLLVRGKLIPSWAIRLLVLALLMPILLVGVDGAARAARRGFPVLRATAFTLAAAAAPAAGLVVILVARILGALPVSPPGLLDAGSGPVSARSVLVAAVALLSVLAVAAIGHRVLTAAGGGPALTPTSRRNPGAAAGVILTLLGLELVMWVRDPYAALILIPALHLWTWALDPDLTWPRPVRLLLWAIGLLPPLLMLAVYARDAGLGPLALVANGTRLLGGGGVGLPALAAGCVLAGCAGMAAASLAARDTLREIRPSGASVRGPAGYAGPGSLGGTDSALRRETLRR